MHSWQRKLDRSILRPFEFFSNFVYYLGQPNYKVRDAWMMAGNTVRRP